MPVVRPRPVPPPPGSRGVVIATSGGADSSALACLLAESIRDYGSVNVLCNNAGVSNTGGVPVWKSSQQDWDWVMGVNFQGVVNGIRVFIPHMLSHGQEAHIVNTSSILGLTTGGGTDSVYAVSKHAVARLTEGIYHDLRERNARHAPQASW